MGIFDKILGNKNITDQISKLAGNPNIASIVAQLSTNKDFMSKLSTAKDDNDVQHLITSAMAAFKEGRFEDVAYFEPFYLKEFVTTVSKKKLF